MIETMPRRDSSALTSPSRRAPAHHLAARLAALVTLALLACCASTGASCPLESATSTDTAVSSVPVVASRVSAAAVPSTEPVTQAAFAAATPAASAPPPAGVSAPDAMAHGYRPARLRVLG